MKICRNVLIVDDHPIIIDGLKSLFKLIELKSDGLSFFLTSVNTLAEAEIKIHEFSKRQNLELVVLDLSLPKQVGSFLNSGLELGLFIRKLMPTTKILVCTFHNDYFILNQVLEKLNPLGCVCKSDMNSENYQVALKRVLAGKNYYSQTVLDVAKKSAFLKQFDKLDLHILKELSNGSKKKDLLEHIALGRSALDKRKRALRLKLNIDSNSDRDLVLKARQRNLI